MSARISLSRKHAEMILRFVDRARTKHKVQDAPTERFAIVSLKSALSPRPKKPMRREREKKQAQKKATKRERRASIREQVMARADGRCECGCGVVLIHGSLSWAPTMDHFWGKAREESVESCWALAAGHHRDKTDNTPSSEYWLELFGRHAVRNGYAEQAQKVAKALAALALSRASAEAGKGAR